MGDANAHANEQDCRKWLTVAAIVAITALAAVFRLWGLSWGLPNGLHDFTYHPDEIFQLGAMLRLYTSGLDPGFYQYPSGYMNLGAAALKVAVGYGLPTTNLYGPYLVARAVAAALGILTVPVVFGIGSKLYGRAAGIIAALVVAIAPLHIVHSHYATVDVPAAFWVALALYGAAVIYRKPTLNAYILAGAAAGIAMGTKYNAALVIVPVVVAHFIREDETSLRGKVLDGRLWFTVASFVLGFFVACPGWLLWPNKFLAGMMFELRHVGEGHGLVFVGRGPGWFDVIGSSLGYGLGVFLLVLSLCAVGHAIIRHRREDWVLLSFLVPYFAMISLSQVRFTRYSVPMVLVLAVLVARMIVSVYLVLREERTLFLRWVWTALCAGVIGYTGIYACAMTGLFGQSDPRESAFTWLQTRTDPRSIVAVPSVPWFHSPPFWRGMTGSVDRRERYSAMVRAPYHLVTNLDKDWDVNLLRPIRPDYVVTSDYEYEDPKRLGIDAYEDFDDALTKSYTEAKVFSKSFSVLGVDFGPTEYLPHDLKYMAPTLRVYRRN